MPLHVEHFTRRTKEIFGSTMTFETPGHAEGLGFIDNRHFIDLTMTTVAANTTINVNSMVEIGVVRKLVDFDPLNRSSRLPTLLDWRETRAVPFDLTLTVAIDTGLRVGNIGVTRNFNKTMTITAVHSELLHVNCVRKRNGLIRLITDACVFRRKVIPNSPDKGTADDCQANKEL